MKLSKFALVKICLLMCVLGLVNILSAAKLIIPVSGSADDATPVAVIPFEFTGTSTSTAPYDFAEIIAADLHSSGEFEPMSRGDMVVEPSEGALFNYSDWRLLGVDVVVTGKYFEISQGNYSLVMDAYDTVRAKKLITYSLPVNSRNLRASAHHLSDVIYTS